MTETPPPTPSTPPPRHTGFFAGVRRLGIWRSDDRWVGGVAGGLAERFGIDPLLVRGIFGVTILFGGIGLLAYGVGWALLPERRDGRIHLEETIAGRFDVALLGAAVLVALGIGRGGSWFFWWGGPPGWVHGIVALAVAAAVVAVVVVATRGAHGPRPGQYPYPGPQPGPYPGPQPGPHRAPSEHLTEPVTSDAQAAADATPTQALPVDAPATASSAATSPLLAAPAPGAPTRAFAAAPTTPYRASAYVTTPAAPTAPSAPSAPYATAAYPDAPTPPSGGWTPATPPPAAPRRPATRGPGAVTVGIVVALALLVLAGLLVAHRTGHFDEPVLLTALGVAVVLAGLGIIASGLRGRTSGVLGFLAIVGLIGAVPLGVVTGNHWAPGADRRPVAVDVAPDTRDTATRGWGFGVGDVTVDLTSVPLTSDTLDVPISVGAGDLTIVVPAGTSVTADVRVGAGQLHWQVGSDVRREDGLGLRDHFATPGAGDDPQLHLRASLGAGNLLIEEG